MKYNFITFHLLILASSGLLVSCVSVRVDVLKEYPAKSRNCHLDVYTTEEAIKKEYEEICILDSETGTNLFSKKTYAQAIELAKPEACLCGADAILVTSVEKVNANMISWGKGRAVLTGIRYK